MSLTHLVTRSLILFCLIGPTGEVAASPAAGTVQATLRTFIPEYRAYAQVQPRKLIVVRAATTGVVSDLTVLPGNHIRAGQVLAKLIGPDYRTALSTARARRDAAHSNLATARENYPQFSSAADVANAQAALSEAQSALNRLQAANRLQAPVGGIVLSVGAADGERVVAGETLLTLQPAGQLWLRAVYYGADAAAVHTDMTGTFVPADSGPSVPVKVAAVSGALMPDGGESVGLFAATPVPRWLNGEFGTVTLKAVPRQLVAVPTRALVLDRGRWWVLVQTRGGLHAQEVVPGPARGWQTFIERGLAPGAAVITENAYLEFHRAISKKFTPPD